MDSGVERGSEVTFHYDPLLAKVIVWAEDRAGAIDRMERALSEFVVLGVRTNISFLRRLLRQPEFRAGKLHTHFLEEHPVPAAPGPPPEALAAAAAALQSGPRRSSVSPDGARPDGSPWLEAGHWRLAARAGGG